MRHGVGDFHHYFRCTRLPLPYEEKRQEKAKAESEAGITTPGEMQSLSNRPSTEDGGSGGEGDNPLAGTDKDGAAKDGAKESQPPSQKYRMTETMKVLIWHLVTLSNECCRLENEKK